MVEFLSLAAFFGWGMALASVLLYAASQKQIAELTRDKEALEAREKNNESSLRCHAEVIKELNIEIDNLQGSRSRHDHLRSRLQDILNAEKSQDLMDGLD